LSMSPSASFILKNDTTYFNNIRQIDFDWYWYVMNTLYEAQIMLSMFQKGIVKLKLVQNLYLKFFPILLISKGLQRKICCTLHMYYKFIKDLCCHYNL
jgi:hypothetical protein